MAVGLLALAAVALYIFGERTYLHVSRTGRRVYWALTAAAGAAALAEAAARIDIAWLVLSAVRESVVVGCRGREGKEKERGKKQFVDGLKKEKTRLRRRRGAQPRRRSKKKNFK